MSDNRYGGKINVWWFNGQPCDMESASRVDYNNGILMNGEKNPTGGCVSQTDNGPLCIASDVTKQDCQAMANLTSNPVWWFNGVPCDTESVSRVDYNNGGILMLERI